MQRKAFIKSTALTLASFSLLNNRTLAAWLRDPAYRVKMLTENIGVFTERGGTILFMLGSDGIVVVDAQFPDTAQHCIDEIKKRSPKPFALLINTHHHADHTAGNIAFKALVPHVLAHENSKKNQMTVAEKNGNADMQLFPDTTYAIRQTGEFSGEKITMKYFGRGHTDGDSCVCFEKSNIMHVGDLVFNRRHPYVDRSAGANIGEWITTLGTGISSAANDTVFVCGHAGEGYDIVLNKADLVAFQTYLQNALRYTRDSIAKGLTKEAFMQVKEIPGSPEWQGDGIERPLEAAWAELHA